MDKTGHIGVLNKLATKRNQPIFVEPAFADTAIRYFNAFPDKALDLLLLPILAQVLFAFV